MRHPLRDENGKSTRKHKIIIGPPKKGFKGRKRGRKGLRNRPVPQAVPGLSLGLSDLVYIRIRQSLVVPIMTSAPNQPDSDQLSSEPISAGHLYVVAGTLSDISRYAGNTADWIIRVARLIFDPLGTGHVYTHTTGIPSDWLTLDKTSDWQVVAPGDPLLTKIYEFDSNHPVTPSMISERHNRSRTTIGSRSSASTFRTQINLRDGDQCVVSGVSMYPTASHLIPKRLGTKISNIVTRFSGERAALGVHCFDPRIGIRLTLNVDAMVDRYQLGFYHITVSYCIFIFSDIVLFNASAL